MKKGTKKNIKTEKKNEIQIEIDYLIGVTNASALSLLYARKNKRKNFHQFKMYSIMLNFSFIVHQE